MIGNLIRDDQEQIAEIKWTVSGKIQSITRTAESTKPNLEFHYDAMGNRISKKTIYPETSTTTYYVHDASGNIMATYETSSTTPTDFILAEQNIFGSSRLGVLSRNINLAQTPTSLNQYARELGNKRYELTNHLGNVLTVVSDRKVAVEDGLGTISHYVADIKSAQDYYPFGMLMPGRNFAGSDKYRFGFNGKEKDDETGTQNYGFRIYNPQIARFLSVDPLTKEYPWYTPYQFAGNTPIMAIDLDGEEPKVVIHLKKDETNSSSRLFVYKATFVLSDHTKKTSNLLETSKIMYFAQGGVEKAGNRPIFGKEMTIKPNIYGSKSHSKIGEDGYAYKIGNGPRWVHGFAYSQGAIGGTSPWSKGCYLPFYEENVNMIPGENVVENKTENNPNQTNILELKAMNTLVKSNNSVILNSDGTQEAGAYMVWDNKDGSDFSNSSNSTEGKVNYIMDLIKTTVQKSIKGFSTTSQNK